MGEFEPTDRQLGALEALVLGAVIALALILLATL